MKKDHSKKSQIASLVLILVACGIGGYFYIAGENNSAIQDQEAEEQPQEQSKIVKSYKDDVLVKAEHLREDNTIRIVEEYREANGTLKSRSYYALDGETKQRVERYRQGGALYAKEWYVEVDETEEDGDEDSAQLQLRYYYRVNGTLERVEGYKNDITPKFVERYRGDETKESKNWYREDRTLAGKEWYREDGTTQRTNYYRQDESLEEVRYYNADQETLERIERYREDGTLLQKRYYRNGVVERIQAYDENENITQ